MKLKPDIYFTIPVMDELDLLPYCLKSIYNQSYPKIKVVLCVNQPENFWSDKSKIDICNNNAKTLNYLSNIKELDITVIDRSSKNNGWKDKTFGVGWARKMVMDYVAAVGNSNDIIICMDADTTFRNDYCTSIYQGFKEFPESLGMSIPYYHNLSGNKNLDRAILRYEIYMRYYLINLFRIRNPYCFTAIGSSMAITVKAYRSVKGISPKLSGEDFYFMQKLRKCGQIIINNNEITYPSARYSNRVFFGTGPAIIKGTKNHWESYPLYSYTHFDKIKDTYALFDELFSHDIETPMTKFLQDIFQTSDLWNPIRKNFKTLDLFKKSCAEKIDGLRILQFLKIKHQISKNEILHLVEYLEKFHPGKLAENDIIPENISFEFSPIADLNVIRNLLLNIENDYRQKIMVIDWY